MLYVFLMYSLLLLYVLGFLRNSVVDRLLCMWKFVLCSSWIVLLMCVLNVLLFL